MAETAGVARYCYNWGLAKWNEMHENGEHCDQYMLSRMWTKEKPDWAKRVNTCSQIKSLLTLGSAFTAFFKGKKAHPAFHKKGKRDSFYVSNDKLRVAGRVVKLPRIGKVRMAEDIRFSGKILRCVVSKVANKWYAGFSIELDHDINITDSTSSVGIDVGLKTWAISSCGDVLCRPSSLDIINKKICHANRVMARKVAGSRNHAKAKARLSTLYRRFVDTKNDAVHKFTHRIAKNHGVVCCEHMCVRGLERSIRPIRRAIHESCMCELRRQLEYKAKHYVEVDRFYPSSKTCSRCGHKKDDLKLSDRSYKCSVCGLIIDRDLNAATNIRNEGMRIFTEGHSESACGGCGSTDAMASDVEHPMKQEVSQDM